MAAAATAIGIAVSTAIASISVTQIIVSIAISFVMSALMTLFADKPKRSLSDRQELIRSATEPRRVVYGQVRVSGNLFYSTSSGTGNKWLHMVVGLASHQSESLDRLWLHDEELTLDGSLNVTDDKYKDHVKIRFHNGSDNQAADADLIAASGGEWTANHRLRGITYVVIDLLYDVKVFPAGIPVPKMIMKGKNTIFDPRDGQTKYTTNWALIEADYITAKIGVDATQGEINEPNLIASANISDENVSTLDGTEKRYVVNGTISADTPREDTINLIATAGMGVVVYAGGQFHIYAGAPTPALITITEDDLAGPVMVSPRTTREQLFNTVRGVFASEADLYQPVDFPMVSNPTYVAEDNGEEIVQTIDFEFSTKSSTVQRLAGISLKRSRQQISVGLTCNIGMLRLQAWDTVLVTLEDFGWTAKKFRVENWSLNADATISLDLREEADSDWDWDYSTEEVVHDPAPDTGLDSPFTHGAVTAITVESGSNLIDTTFDGTLISKMKISFTPPPYSESIIIGWRQIGELDYQYSSPLPGANSIVIGPVVDTKTYELEFTSFNGLGVPSETPAITTHTVEGKLTDPGDADSFTFKVQADGTRQFNFAHANPDADVRVGGGYNIPYQTGATIDVSMAAKLNTTGLITSSPYETNLLPKGEYTFALQVVDSSGNVSQNPLIITVNLPDPRVKNSLYFASEFSEGWLGTRTDCFINGEGRIEAEGSGTWADFTTWAAMADTWLEIVPSKSPITYVTPVIDLTADTNFNPLVTVEGLGTSAVQMRSQSDALGSDLSALPFGATALTTNRYVQFEITMTGTTPLIEDILVNLDGEFLLDEKQDIDTSLTSNGVFEKIATGHFKIGIEKNISGINLAQIIAFQNVGPGFTWELLSKETTLANSTLAAEFKIYNSAGTLADATIDILLKGPKA